MTWLFLSSVPYTSAFTVVYPPRSRQLLPIQMANIVKTLFHRSQCSTVVIKLVNSMWKKVITHALARCWLFIGEFHVVESRQGAPYNLCLLFQYNYSLKSINVFLHCLSPQVLGTVLGANSKISKSFHEKSQLICSQEARKLKVERDYSIKQECVP